eukprot:1677739-Rhodomonas_salina.1
MSTSPLLAADADGQKGKSISPTSEATSATSSNGHAREPAVGWKRQIVTERFDVHEAGSVHKMYKRLKAGRQQVARGT